MDSLAETSQLMWASPSAVLQVFQAKAVRCHIITLDNLKKGKWIGRDLSTCSLDTVKLLQEDGVGAGYPL